jgi:hypothetical protein
MGFDQRAGAGFHRRDRDAGVRRWRREHVHGIELGLGEHPSQIGVDTVDLEIGGARARAASSTGSHTATRLAMARPLT